eukprot:403354262
MLPLQLSIGLLRPYLSAVFSVLTGVYSITILAMSPQKLVSGGSINALQTVSKILMWISVGLTSMIFTGVLVLAFSAHCGMVVYTLVCIQPRSIFQITPSGLHQLVHQ